MSTSADLDPISARLGNAMPPNQATFRFARPPELLLAHEPARYAGLDGLRGLAVTAVVVYHVAPSWLPAGFLGVSLFFTLSGFLITRLLLAERFRTGSVDVRSFLQRRFRRLLPASLLTLATVAVAWTVTGWMTRGIAGDIVASTAQVANWHFLATGTSYGAATEASPVLHFWSLAIEEQFYLVFAPTVWLVTRRARQPVAALTAVLVAGLVASLAATFVWSTDPMRVYFSSITRAGEVLVGGVLAVVTWWLPRRRWSRGLPAGGAVALAALGILCVTTTFTSPVWASGGLIGVALLSALTITAAVLPGRVARALSAKPLVHLGAVSYGVYLFHWPILVALRTTALSAPVIAVITVGSSLLLAELSFRLLERPVRDRLWRPRALPALAVLSVTLVVGVSLWGASRSTDPSFDFEALRDEVQSLDAAQTSSSVPDDAQAPAGAPPTPTSPVGVSVFGDSTAVLLRLGLTGSDDRLSVRQGWADVGCPLSRGGEFRGTYVSDEGWATPVERCDWTESWPDAVRAGQSTVAVVYGGFWDTLPRRHPELWDGWRTIEDPVVAEFVERELLALTDALHDAGAERVVWLTLAPNSEVDSPQNRRRVPIFNALLAEVERARPDVAVVVDLGAHLENSPLPLRPDGVHLSPTTGPQLVRDWLGDQLAAAVTSR